jgi:hypothetical protein
MAVSSLVSGDCIVSGASVNRGSLLFRPDGVCLITQPMIDR